MRQLTLQEIKRFASRQNVRRIAVENFLLSVTNNQSSQDAYRNLFRDARLYRWNNETIKAIKEGIDLSIRKVREEK